jgi:hypothetical protein
VLFEDFVVGYCFTDHLLISLNLTALLGTITFKICGQTATIYFPEKFDSTKLSKIEIMSSGLVRSIFGL